MVRKASIETCTDLLCARQKFSVSHDPPKRPWGPALICYVPAKSGTNRLGTRTDLLCARQSCGKKRNCSKSCYYYLVYSKSLDLGVGGWEKAKHSSCTSRGVLPPFSRTLSEKQRSFHSSNFAKCYQSMLPKCFCSIAIPKN